MKSVQKQRASFAKSFWNPTQREKLSLEDHSYVERLDQVDQIWDWLKLNHGEVLAVNSPHGISPERFTYKELSDLIDQVASAFNYFGIGTGDVVALFAENSPRWLAVDQGLMRVGSADAVRGSSAPVDELKYIIKDSSAKALVIQNGELWRKLSLDESCENDFNLVLQLEGEPDSREEGVLSWHSFLDIGKRNEGKYRLNFKDTPGNVATILYTSGTTGQPKGVPLSHSNLLHQIRSLACVAYPPPGSAVLSVLPIWHAYERSAEYYFFSCACTQHYTNIKQLKHDLPRVKPLVMATVPRLWEAINEGFNDALRQMSPGKQRFIRMALSNSKKYKRALRISRGLLVERVNSARFLSAFFTLLFRAPAHLLASSLIWPKVLEKLTGGKLVFPINGGGAIAPHVDSFFEALGVELLVGYGLTETSPVISCRRPWSNIRGTAGTPLPKTEFRIVNPENGQPMRFRETGLVLVRGPQVMKGYLGKSDATKKVLDSEGWFNTGDLGMLLPNGSILLTGRAKDTIVLSTGENIEPGPLEAFIVSSPLVEQVLFVGQDQRQLGALIVPHKENLMAWAAKKELSLSEDWSVTPGNYELRRALKSEINYLLTQRTGSRLEERVLGLALVEPFSIENGLLTQTLKQKRDVIVSRDNAAIASIFGN